MQDWEPIPAPRRDAVRTALQAAFGTDAIDRFDSIKGGVSGALILRFAVRERPYVLRLEPERTALGDRQRNYTCMTAAAAAGAAPRVHFSDAASGLALMDFVSGRPLAEHPGGPLGLVRAIGRLIAKVQTTPLFPSPWTYPEIIEYLLNRLSGSESFSIGEWGACAEGLARIRAALPSETRTQVSAHNDPNPRNILYDGERLLLVDWELAFRNDPLVDVAILTTDLAETPELEIALLEATFGSPPDRRKLARLAVIRLLTRLYYGCVVLDSLTGRLQPMPDPKLAPRTPAAFRLALAEGHLKSGTAETAYAFARMSLACFTDGISDPGFGELAKEVQNG